MSASTPSPEPALQWRKVMAGWYRADVGDDTLERYSVIRDGRGWALTLPYDDRPSSWHFKKSEAVAKAEALFRDRRGLPS